MKGSHVLLSELLLLPLLSLFFLKHVGNQFLASQLILVPLGVIYSQKLHKFGVDFLLLNLHNWGNRLLLLF